MRLSSTATYVVRRLDDRSVVQLGVLVLGVDPGSARTGYCWKMRESQNISPTIERGIILLEDLEKWLLSWDSFLEKWPHDRFIVACEKFIQRDAAVGTGRWLKQGTAEIYGATWLNAIRLGARFVPSWPSNLTTGCRLAGIKWNGRSHLRDDYSAEAHAAHLCFNGIPKTSQHPIG